MTDFEFSTVLTSLAKDEVLIPALQTALFDPSFSGFDIHIRDWKSDVRYHDGRFHPSAHATWTLRQLYLYLVRPELLVEERMPLTGVLAVTQGKFWHEFVQRVLADQGSLKLAEVPIDDPATNIKGHADGYLASGEGFEFKTGHSRVVAKVNSEEDLKQFKYPYWCQAQDYLMVTGWPRMRFLFLSPEYPFPMSEFIVEPDIAHHVARRRIYTEAVRLAALYPHPEIPVPEQGVPVCCAPRSTQAKQCVGRRICSIGAA